MQIPAKYRTALYVVAVVALAGSFVEARPRGECGTLISDLLPHTGKIADEICLVRSMHTEAVNHAPGVTFFMTGAQVPGRPSMGAWMSYGLGCETADLPAFVVMSTGGGVSGGAANWSSGASARWRAGPANTALAAASS